MFKITIKKLNSETPSEPWQVNVGKDEILGNTSCIRDQKLYAEWLYNRMCESLYVTELLTLAQKYKEYGKLELFCDCTHKKCHAEVIKGVLIKHFLHY